MAGCRFSEVCYEQKITDLSVKHRRFAVFASYNSLGKIDHSTVMYLKNLHNCVDGIVFIADNPILPEELSKIRGLVLYASFQRHGEYDFGSYKRGWQFLKEKHLLEQADEILFCNDSILGVFRPVSDIFDEAAKRASDFFGLTINSFVFSAVENKNIERPHVQSFFMLVSKKIFSCSFFDDFMVGIKAEENKDDIIEKYEVGLSDLICKNGFSLGAFYQNKDTSGAPCKTEKLDLLKEGLFIKKSLLSKTESRLFNMGCLFKSQRVYRYFLFFEKIRLLRYDLFCLCFFGKIKTKFLKRREKLRVRLARLEK